MTEPNSAAYAASPTGKALEIAIRIGLVFLLVAWCFQIVRPFIVPVVWGIIISVATYPGYHWVLGLLGGRNRLAAALYTLSVLVLVVGPALLLTGTLVEGATGLASDLSDGTLSIPPPPRSVGSWPLIGEETERFWTLASVNIQEALQQVAPQLKTVGSWLLAAAAGASFGILQFVLAIVIAGALQAYAAQGHRAAYAIAVRLAGERGRDLADLAETTVRSVARGILGVSIIQSLAAGLGFLVAGVPAAGLWALLCLLLGIAQIGILVILVPIVIYLFNTADTLTAVGFLIWSIPVGLLDNILKPIFLGRGVKTPMLIVFLGAIGGFLNSGIIGLFIGAVILALSYELFMRWLHHDP